ncbi:histidinol-phosphatase [Halalkalibacter alkaliphilus]|uniref:Histidinol-phosphatase n=1 Tax=Halalkalibacter alkaliphilus TaxID=2917993 RepID=A0A9X2CRS2_9BACI|nr:histidinol-phosphatase [Halalkalibacter alkaliphilus]MCL7746850.1 histidinol-phosphatase [Halalkalibacter alkaliphilus]
MIDYHTHHYRCGHASGSLRDMIEEAIAKGFQQIGLSDHSPLFFYEEDHFNPGMTMAKSEFPNYVAEVIRLRDEYEKRIDVRVGVESDFIEGWEDYYRSIYAQYPFDYIIGSVHYFGGYHVFDPKRWEDPSVDPDQIYREYFTLIKKSVDRCFFDILGHADAVKGLKYPASSDLTKEMDETIEAIAKSGVTVELNTSGVRKCGEVFPSPEFLYKLNKRGVTFTFGSDAHSPNELGYAWTETLHLLKELGVSELATFKNRERKMIEISAVSAVGK